MVFPLLGSTTAMTGLAPRQDTKSRLLLSSKTIPVGAWQSTGQVVASFLALKSTTAILF